MRIEWRSDREGTDTLLAIDEKSNIVKEAWCASAALLENFLNDMDQYGSEDNKVSIEAELENPQQWGGLVIARSDSGDVVGVDPELYWDRVTYWFRAQGKDPHSWSRRK